MDEELAELRRLKYLPSRIPALDALEVFVPEGSEPDKALREFCSRTGFSRWFPVEGGHRVLTLHEGGKYDASRFSLLKGAWDHEHCKRCGERIESMTLCWVSRDGPYTVLCEKCYRLVSQSPESGTAV